MATIFRMKSGYAISLALNAVLLAVVIVRWTTSHPLAQPAAHPSPSSASASAADSAALTPTPAVDPIHLGAGWQTWIEPLRAAGVPTDVLAGLVRADFDHRWQAHQADLQTRYMRGELDADGLAAAALEHDAGLDRELQAALGPGPYRTWDMQRVLAGLHTDAAQLSAAERDTVYDLERSLRDASQQAQLDKLQGRIDQATLDSRQQGAQDALNQKLRALLGDQRAAQLQGADDTLGRLKRALSDTPLTDGQLEALAAAQRQWDRTRSDLVTRQVNTADASLDPAIQANDDRFRAQFDLIAGPGAYDRYAKSQDSRYVDLQRNAGRWGVAPGEVDQVFADLRNFEDTVQAYTRDAESRAVATPTIAAALQQFTAETQQQMKTELGPAAYAHLAANGVAPVVPPAPSGP